MNKKEKALLDKAIPYDYRNPKPMKIFYLLNAHRRYKGFWGKNGYNNIIVIGTYWEEGMEDEVFYRFDDCKERDLVEVFVQKHMAVVKLDIDSKYDTLRLCLDERVIVPEYNLSNFVIKTSREETK